MKNLKDVPEVIESNSTCDYCKHENKDCGEYPCEDCTDSEKFEGKRVIEVKDES